MNQKSETLQLVQEIKINLTQKSSSQKDEVRVMQTMLNDKEYVVGEYSAVGKVGEYSPYADSRRMLASVIAGTTHISKEEAEILANDHQFTKTEAASMVGISKEYVSTYMGTGRKLPLGGRELSNVALIGKDIEKSVTRYPSKVGIDDNGEARYVNAEKRVPAHQTVKVIAGCPEWVK